MQIFFLSLFFRRQSAEVCFHSQPGEYGILLLRFNDSFGRSKNANKELLVLIHCSYRGKLYILLNLLIYTTTKIQAYL